MKVKEFKDWVNDIPVENDEMEIYAAPLMEFRLMDSGEKQISPVLWKRFPVEMIAQSGIVGAGGVIDSAMVIGFDSELNVARLPERLDDEHELIN